MGACCKPKMKAKDDKGKLIDEKGPQIQVNSATLNNKIEMSQKTISKINQEIS